MPRKARDPQISAQAIATARAARAVPDGFLVLESKAHLLTEEIERFKAMSPSERGAIIRDGLAIQDSVPMLYKLLERLGLDSVSHLVEPTEITLMVGDTSYTAPTQAQALLKLLEGCLSSSRGHNPSMTL